MKMLPAYSGSSALAPQSDTRGARRREQLASSHPSSDGRHSGTSDSRARAGPGPLGARHISTQRSPQASWRTYSTFGREMWVFCWTVAVLLSLLMSSFYRFPARVMMIMMSLQGLDDEGVRLLGAC